MNDFFYYYQIYLIIYLIQDTLITKCIDLSVNPLRPAVPLGTTWVWLGARLSPLRHSTVCMHSDSVCIEASDTIDQGWTTSGPRASCGSPIFSCGPPSIFIVEFYLIHQLFFINKLTITYSFLVAIIYEVCLFLI